MKAVHFGFLTLFTLTGCESVQTEPKPFSKTEAEALIGRHLKCVGVTRRDALAKVGQDGSLLYVNNGDLGKIISVKEGTPGNWGLVVEWEGPKDNRPWTTWAGTYTFYKYTKLVDQP